MREKHEEKHINVTITLEYYEKLKEIAKYESRFICRQAEYLIENAIDEYIKKRELI